MSVVIKVENLSKLYRLGDVGTGTISHDINRWWHRIRGKEDPYLKIGETNDRTSKGSSDYVWALKDINFEVKQGEVLGIIGRNGAGKSTLLKILSRTTAPTTGSVKIKGRVASLLEVGTGFHPELSGRDNIFLNGAIMGMTRREIQSKFDEIVDFAGVERYIDTPVKRYSSGMYVRLAFAVAAHLDPEILIVDEVLAVGDAEFQKKCLGKMKDVSEKQGRTVLFVSHNLSAIQQLCYQALLLEEGNIKSIGDIHLVLEQYFNKGRQNSYVSDIFLPNSTLLDENKGFAKSFAFESLSDEELKEIRVGQFWQIRVKFQLFEAMTNFTIGVGVTTSTEIPIYTSWSNPVTLNNGQYEAVFVNDSLMLAAGTYNLVIGLSNSNGAFHYLQRGISFEVLDIRHETILNDSRILKTSNCGLVLNPVTVTINKIK